MDWIIFYSLAFLLVMFIFAYIAYRIIKAAVRDAIVEARDIIKTKRGKNAEDKILQVTCEECGEEYDMDYFKCPFCGTINKFENTTEEEQT